MIKNKLSDIVANQLPEHITEAYPTFVEFLQAYYKYLETQQVYRNIETVRDVETTLDTFIDLLKNEFAVEYPEFAKDRFFLKNTGHISVAHGSEQSYKFLFRQIFKKEVDIRYPKDQILTLSNSLWVQDISFFAIVTAGDVTKLENNFIQIDTIVNGIKTKNRVYVKRVEFVETTQNTYEIFISKDYYGSILEGDTISYNGVFATIIPTTVGIKIVKAGYGFSVGQVFNVESGTGSGLSFKITEVTLVGGIKSCQIITYGVNYKSTFAFDLPSSVILQDSVEVDGFKISAVSTQQRFYDSGIITKQNYYNSSYSNDYVGTIVANFSSLTVPSSVQINTARLQVNLGTVAKYQGYYSKSTGLVSSPDSIIQDSYYYQDFSYVLRIDEAFETYRDVVLSLLHPTGRQMFAEYVIDNLYELEYAIVEPVFKILLPLYSGIPDVVVMLDRLSYALQKFEESEQFITDLVSKKLERPVSSETTIDDVKRWLFESPKASSVSPTEALYWNFDAPKFSDNILTDALKYTLETPKASSISTPLSAPNWVFAAPKASSINTPTDVSYWTFAAPKTSDNTILSAPSWVFAAPKASSVTSLSAPSWVFATPQASSINTPTDVSYWTFASPKASSINTPTDVSYWTFATPQASSINTPTDVSYWTFATPQASSLSTPTDATYWTFATPQASSINTPTDSIPLTTNKLLGLSSTIRNLLVYTEQFDTTTSWIKFGTATVTANTVLAPDGNTTADSVTLPVGSGIYQNTAASPNTKYTFSVYIRAASAVTVRHVINSNLADPTTATLNITTEWQRFVLTKTTATGTTYISSQLDTGSGATIYVWGAQTELGSYTTPYQGVAASGVLVEAAAVRNLLTYSEQLDNVYWSKSNSSITANATTAPDGSPTADFFVEDTSNTTHSITPIVTINSGTTYTFSFYAKAGTRSIIEFAGLGFSAQGYNAIFDLSSGLMTSNTGGFGKIISVGNSWYRCQVVITASNTTTPIIYLNNGTTSTYTGNGTSGLYLWGAQLELGSNVTTYQRIGDAATAADSLAVPVDSSSFTFAAPKTSDNTATDSSYYSLARLIAPAVNAFAAYSNDFTNANWNTLGSSTIANTIAAPDTSLTADTIVEDITTTSQHRALTSFTAVVGNTYTTSYYLKAGTRTWAAVRLSEASTPDFAFFNLSTGTIGTVAAGLTARIENYGNGWYRCFVTRVATNVSMNSAINISTGDTVAIYTGLGSGYYLYAWGADVRETDPVVATDVSYFSLANVQASTLSTPTDAIPLTTNKLLGLTSTIRNLLTYTEDLTQWSTAGLTPTITNSATVAAPNGAYTAESIIYPVSANGSAIVYNNFTSFGTFNTLYSGSIYLKANGYNFVRVAFNNTAFSSTATGCVVNLTTGVITSTLNASKCTINDAGSGWYRVTVTGTSDADGGNYIFGINTQNTASDGTLTPNGTSGIYAWGAQVELGETTTVYQGIAASGVLIEAAAIRNLLRYTEQFDNVIWNKSAATITTDSSTAPDGTTTADKLVESATTAQHFVYWARTASNETVTFSAFCKAAERTSVLIQLSNFTSATAQAVFDLSNGTINTISAGNSDYTAPITSIVAYPNGWYRCILTTTKGSVNTTNNPTITLWNSTGSYAGNGTSGAYIWGAQLETNSSPTTYQRIGDTSTAADSLAVPTDSSKFTFATLQGSTLSTPTDSSKFTFATPQGSSLSTPTDTTALTTLRKVGNFDANSIRRNLANYTEQFDNSVWGKGNITITVDTITAPDGTTTADKIVEAATTAQHLTGQRISSTLGLTYTYSIYAKAAEWTTVTLQLGAGGPTGNFDLTAKTATLGLGALYASIQDVGNGWFKCKVVGISNGFGNIYVFKTSAPYAGDGTSGIYVWGAQLETTSLAYSELTGFGGLAIATGSIFLTTNLTAAQQSTFAVGSYVTLYPTSSVLNTASPNIWMSGTITSWSGNSISANITSTSITTGTFVDWAFVLGGPENIFPSSAYQGIAANAVINSNSVRNLLSYSEQFDNTTYWGVSNGTVTSNATAAPDGNLTADKLVANSTNALFLSQHHSIISGVTYTYSIYVKAAELTSVVMLLYGTYFNSGGTNPSSTFDLSTGTITSVTVAPKSSSSINVGNGWWRISITQTATATGSYANQIIRLATVTSGQGVYVWGAQLELLENPTIYQPTLATGVALNSATLRNLLTYTEQFDNAIWVKGGIVTVTANTGIAPDFTPTADTLSGSNNTTFGTTFRSTGIPCTAGLSYTGSIYVKTLTATTVKLRLRTGAVGTPDDINTTFTPTTSWQRIFITLPITVDNNNLVFIVGGTDGDILIWGAQLEVGSQPSSYQRINGINETDSLTFPTDNLNILTSRPVASSLTTPTDTQTFVTDKVVSSTQINTDSGNVYLNAYNVTQYFADMSYLQATQSF